MGSGGERRGAEGSVVRSRRPERTEEVPRPPCPAGARRNQGTAARIGVNLRRDTGERLTGTRGAEHAKRERAGTSGDEREHEEKNGCGDSDSDEASPLPPPHPPSSSSRSKPLRKKKKKKKKKKTNSRGPQVAPGGEPGNLGTWEQRVKAWERRPPVRVCSTGRGGLPGPAGSGVGLRAPSRDPRAGPRSGARPPARPAAAPALGN